MLYGNEYLVCAERHGTILVMPFTIHASWIRVDEPGSTSQLFLWAEDPDVVAKASPAFATMAPEAGRSANLRQSNGRSTSSRSATGRARGPKVPSHPAQVSIGQLRALLTSDPIHVQVNQLQPANARVWLPSQGGVPLTRRSVFQSNGSGRSGMVRVAEAPMLEQWQVTGLALAPLAALHFLGHLSNINARQNGGFHRMRLGNDLLFWSNAAKFALEILVGQYYLPSLRIDPSGRLEAVWQPLLLDPRVEQRREQLVRTMPPVCRAYNLDALTDAPAPASLTEHFVATLVDAAVRNWGSNQAPSPMGTPAQHWLHGLLSPQPYLHLPPQPAHDLYQEWYQWTEQLFVVRDANFRICFVLEEPALARA
jgi:hypothetical protein